MNSVSVSTATAVQIDKVEDCMICQESISVEKIETRKCGHKFCRPCDSEWRRGSAIKHTRKTFQNAEQKKMVQHMYHISSTCPGCRAEEKYDDLMSRSKESLVSELSNALGMLYNRNIFRVGNTCIEVCPDSRRQVTVARRAVIVTPRAPAQYEMDDLTRQLIHQLNMEDQAIIAAAPAPVVAPIATPAPVAALIAAPAPVVHRPREEAVHAYGLLTRPVRPRGRPREGPRTDLCTNSGTGCTTVKTKLRCLRCNIVLCRTCKTTRQCPTCDRGVL